MMNNSALGMRGRFFVTLVLLALVYSAGRTPLPGVTWNDYGSSLNDHRTISVVALGLNPFLIGFVAVELLSFVFPLGRRLRQGGIIGRKKLNSYAVGVAVGLALLQAFGISAALQSSEQIVIANSGGLMFALTSVLTLAGGAAFLFVTAKLISRWGIGNGFCVVLTFSWLESLVRSTGPDWWTEPRSWVPLECDLVLATIGLFLWMFSRQPQAEFANAEGASIASLGVPAFPQGIVPVVWAYSIVALLSTLRMLRVHLPDVEKSIAGLFVIAILIATFSFITAHFFFGPERWLRNLPGGALPLKAEAISRRLALQSSALLVVLGIAFPAGAWFGGFHFVGFLLPALAVLAAFGSDLWAEWRFRQRHADAVACAIELDNVYLASYLRGLLAANGCDALIRAFYYRSLFFFFQPIFKIELMVPAAQLEQAWDLIEPEKIQVA